MKLEHYVIEKTALAEHPLQSYDTPLDRVWGRRVSPTFKVFETALLWLNGPAKIFVNSEGKIAILSKPELNKRKNFRDMRLRRYIDPVRIVDITKNVNVRGIEEAVLGRCEVPGCNEIALYEEGDPTLACSPNHMKQLCGYEGEKRLPLKVFNRCGDVKVYLA